MLHFKKPLFIFSIIVLFITIISAFFIRQKILNDWKIKEFNNFLNTAKILEEEIETFKQDLEKNIKNKENIEKENHIKKQNIQELVKFIDSYDKKVKELNLRNVSIKRVKGIVSISKKYQELKEKIEQNLEKEKLSDWKKLLTSYHNTISAYINDRKKILKEINKYINIKKKTKEQKIKLITEIKESDLFLFKLNDLIEKTKEKLNEKILKLSSLQNINFSK